MSPQNRVLKRFNQYPKSNKTLFIIYAGLKALIEMIHGSKNNP